MKYITIKWPDGNIYFGRISGRTWYWGTGFGYCNLPEKHEILAMYDGGLDDDDFYYTSYISHLRAYGPKHILRQGCGWLAPDGKFYPCKSYGHNSMGEDLHLLYYDHIPGLSPVPDIENKGWLKVYADFVCWPEIPLTQPQIDTLFDLAMLDPETPLAKCIMDLIRE